MAHNKQDFQCITLEMEIVYSANVPKLGEAISSPATGTERMGPSVLPEYPSEKLTAMNSAYSYGASSRAGWGAVCHC